MRKNYILILLLSSCTLSDSHTNVAINIIAPVQWKSVANEFELIKHKLNPDTLSLMDFYRIEFINRSSEQIKIQINERTLCCYPVSIKYFDKKGNLLASSILGLTPRPRYVTIPPGQRQLLLVNLPLILDSTLNSMETSFKFFWQNDSSFNVSKNLLIKNDKIVLSTSMDSIEH